MDSHDNQDRIASDSLNILAAFQRGGDELLIGTCPELGSAATDTFLLNMMASLAEFKRETLRSRLA